QTLLEDLGKRPFVTVGFLAWLLLLPLALTSTDASVKRLGFKTWKLLHRLAYVAAAFGVIHFLWRVKKDASEPIYYGLAVGVLLALRVWDWNQRRQRARYA
ncbi:MAG TPA: ferric reductase-like transmembrane domain-containing protein, partial [Polyangiales bacterium]|nr:ferric reductase-like transmembrane domain-containing protein [Polyangiales bacterium]